MKIRVESREGKREAISREALRATRMLVAAGLALSSQLAYAVPGVPQAPIQLYFENFENRPAPTTTVQMINAYTGAAAALNQTYTADAFWLNASNCNGAVLSQASSGNFTACPNRVQLGQIAQVMGLYHGLSSAASVNESTLSAYTAGSGGNNLIQLQTVNLITLPGSTNRFISFGVDTVQTSCPGDPSENGTIYTGTNPAQYNFFLVSAGNVQTALNSTPVNACSGGTIFNLPATNQQAYRARSILANSPVLYGGGTQFRLRMRNAQGNGAGNDGVVDNFVLVDMTPTLDKVFSPASIRIGQTAALTFTITNTTDLFAKSGWTFTDTLPSGLTVATPAATTTCGGGTTVVAATGSNTIAVTAGNLAAGVTSCTVTVNVTAGAIGTYTNNASNISNLSGLNPPGSTTLTVAAPDLTVAKTHVGNFTRGSNGTFSLAISNVGGTATVGTLTFVDTLPIGFRVNNGAAGPVALGGANGADWTCNSAAAANDAVQTLTCTSTTALAAGGVSNVTLDVQVTSAAAVGNKTNTVTVSGGGQVNTANDTANDTVPIVAGANVTFSDQLCNGNANMRDAIDWAGSTVSTSYGAGPYNFSTAGSGINSTVGASSAGIRKTAVSGTPSPFGGSYLELSNPASPTTTIQLSQAVRVETMLIDYDNTETATIVGFNGATRVLPAVTPHSSNGPYVTNLGTSIEVRSSGYTFSDAGDFEPVTTADVVFSSPVDRIVITHTGSGTGSGAVLDLMTCAPQLAVKKQTTGGTASFDFNAGNGFGAATLDTASSNPATSTARYLTSANVATNITETALTGWTLDSADCVDSSGTAVGSTLAGNVLTLPAANVDLDTSLTCTFRNVRSIADLTITKTNTPGVNGDVDQASDTVSAGNPTTYTIKVVNNGPITVTGAVVKDTAVSGLACPVGNVVTCTGTGCPAGPITIANLQSGLALGTLTATAPNNTVSLLFSCNVP